MEPGDPVYVWPDSGTPEDYPGVLLGAGVVLGLNGDMADVEIEGVVDCYPLEWLRSPEPSGRHDAPASHRPARW